jgi:hypothetical protein
MIGPALIRISIEGSFEMISYQTVVTPVTLGVTEEPPVHSGRNQPELHVLYVSSTMDV